MSYPSPFYTFFKRQFSNPRLRVKENSNWCYIRYIPEIDDPRKEYKINLLRNHLRRWTHTRLDIGDGSEYSVAEPVYLYKGPPIHNQILGDGTTLWLSLDDVNEVALNIFTQSSPAGRAIYSYLENFIKQSRFFLSIECAYIDIHYFSYHPEIDNELGLDDFEQMVNIITEIRHQSEQFSCIIFLWYYVIMKR